MCKEKSLLSLLNYNISMSSGFAGHDHDWSEPKINQKELEEK